MFSRRRFAAPVPRSGGFERGTRNRRLLPLALGLLAALVLTGTAAAANPWLHASGQNFVDGNGQPVVLRGFNVADPPAGLPAAVAAGANFVRLPIYWGRIEPNAPQGGTHTYSGTELGRIDQAVSYLQSHHVNVLLDFHQWHWSPYFPYNDAGAGGKGIPAWLYEGTGLPRTASGLNQAVTDFYTSPTALDLYSSFVRFIVGRYSAYPNVVGYEVLNEPPSGTYGNKAKATTALVAWEAKVRAVISTADPSRIVFFMLRTGADLGVKNADLSPFGSLQNVALDFHDYSGGTGDDYSAHTENYGAGRVWVQVQRSYWGTLDNQRAGLRPAVDRARQWNIPLLVGEWGARNDNSGLAAYQAQMLGLFDDCGLSWSRWQLGQDNNLSVVDRSGALNAAGNQIASGIAAATRTSVNSMCVYPGPFTFAYDHGTANVQPRADVTLTASRPLDCSTVSSATISISPAVTIAPTCSERTILLHNARMTLGTDYTVTVTGAVRDAAGNPLGSDQTIPFRTVAMVSTRVRVRGSAWGIRLVRTHVFLGHGTYLRMSVASARTRHVLPLVRPARTRHCLLARSRSVPVRLLVARGRLVHGRIYRLRVIGGPRGHYRLLTVLFRA